MQTLSTLLVLWGGNPPVTDHITSHHIIYHIISCHVVSYHIIYHIIYHTICHIIYQTIYHIIYWFMNTNPLTFIALRYRTHSYHSDFEGCISYMSFWHLNKMNENNRQICEDQIVIFKQSHILLYHGLLFLTRSTCVIVDPRSHICKSHDFIPRFHEIYHMS